MTQHLGGAMFRRMKAIHLVEGRGVEALALVELPDPVPGPGEVVVRMRAASLNHRDLLVIDGAYAPFRRPFVPLSDGAGDVVAVGAGVERVAPGDRVVLSYVASWTAGPPTDERVARRLGGPDDGVLAERVRARADAVVRLPACLGDEEAATLPIAGVTAYRALFVDERLAPGQCVVVQGTGGVASFAALLAKQAGARVIATTRTREKAERARSLGADEVVVLDEHPAWDQRVLELTGGRGADRVIDVAGGRGLDRSIAACRTGGTVHLVGFLETREASFDLALAMRRVVTLRAASAGSREDLEGLVAALASGDRRPPVDLVMPWTEVREAVERMRARRHVGKIVLRFA
ncbi:zinc-dependent alcohol dehydrogenase family protein [Sorangium sp. So ce131]|uniref:zinc-dependent alcohol dehydrogenase family protein n=1 Tax=Sorangium sp. So ce131 TaxID=3133282 RepID=UPI003F620055